MNTKQIQQRFYPQQVFHSKIFQILQFSSQQINILMTLQNKNKSNNVNKCQVQQTQQEKLLLIQYAVFQLLILMLQAFMQLIYIYINLVFFKRIFRIIYLLLIIQELQFLQFPQYYYLIVFNYMDIKKKKMKVKYNLMLILFFQDQVNLKQLTWNKKNSQQGIFQCLVIYYLYLFMQPYGLVQVCYNQVQYQNIMMNQQVIVKNFYLVWEQVGDQQFYVQALFYIILVNSQLIK
ncbi:hypothetical protein IMG5_100100 [Ichthyophthirius multifiliis]|uniref:Transmembrane protein n=1 Tax=Ichthyophthirius multifiliis TaxID=5932 RepID=G0QSB4_ICHMU|nr:hypothetical protein IMG5_100100 [Ichthyophthirius multifiliis]EGR31861.1 hypothetical protein IMG5_100100 [Ichthyophthirius multifiliis]|eukprot:XP_004035347.1 hypothetical protein IMG5_100100 [Ichthyophthirius multifiliis]